MRRFLVIFLSVRRVEMSLILVLAWSLLMLQDSADQRDSVPGPVVNTPAAAAEALSMDRVSLEEIPALVSSGEYQPVASAELQRLLASARRIQEIRRGHRFVRRSTERNYREHV